MFAGKTTETLKRILWAKNGRGQSIRVSSRCDQRYARLQIVSHEGLAAIPRPSSTGTSARATMIEKHRRGVLRRGAVL